MMTDVKKDDGEEEGNIYLIMGISLGPVVGMVYCLTRCLWDWRLV